MAELPSETYSSGLVLYSREEKNSDVDEIWDDSALIDAYDKAVRKAKSMIKERQRRSSTSGSITGSSSVGDPPKTNRNKGRHKGNSKERSSRNKWTKWRTGDHCQALYIDGILYEAEILSVNHEKGSCDVQFYGYGNSESVLLKDVHPSLGEQARLIQLSQAQTDVKKEQRDHKRQRDPSRSKKSSDPPKVSSNSTSSYSHHMSESMPGAHSQHQRFTPTSSLPPWMPSFLSNAVSMVPPPPPHPPFDNMEEDEDALSTMLMAWYMSGYHTGYYQGLKCGKQRMNGSCGGHGSGCGQTGNCSRNSLHH